MSPLMHSCLVELCARNRLQSEWGKQIISEQEIELDGQIICVIMDSHVIGSRQSQHSCWSKEDVGRKSRKASSSLTSSVVKSHDWKTVGGRDCDM